MIDLFILVLPGVGDGVESCTAQGIEGILRQGLKTPVLCVLEVVGIGHDLNAETVGLEEGHLLGGCQADRHHVLVQVCLEAHTVARGGCLLEGLNQLVHLSAPH